MKNHKKISILSETVFRTFQNFEKKIINHSFHYTVQTFMFNLCVFTLQGEISTI